MNTDLINYQGGAISDEELLAELPEELQILLRKINGFIAFDGGLHIRGVVDFPEWHSLQKVWFGDFALIDKFSSLDKKDIPFAQDCFGDQFLFRNEKVWRLSAETDDLENLNLNLNDFLFQAEENPIEFLSLEPLLKFKNEGGLIENGELINVYPPFCTKESASGVSMKAVPMFQQITFLADFAKQVNNL